METIRPATAMPDDTPAALAFFMEIAERMIPAIHIKRHTVFTYGIQNRQQLTIPITRAAIDIPVVGIRAADIQAVDKRAQQVVEQAERAVRQHLPRSLCRTMPRPLSARRNFYKT